MKEGDKDFHLEDADLSRFRKKLLQLDQDARIADNAWWLQQHGALALFIAHVHFVDSMAKAKANK